MDCSAPGFPKALLPIKLVKVMEFQLLFKILENVAALNMSANLGNQAVATGLEKVNPHPNYQEGQY